MLEVVLLEGPKMNFILRISNKIKWKVNECGVTPSFIDELHSRDIQGDQK